MPHHAEKKFLPYTDQQLFDLIIDINAYPTFLPWCVSARIRDKADNKILADLAIGYKIFRETFVSEVEFEEPSLIKVNYRDGPFKYLNSSWTLFPHINEKGIQGCIVDFNVDFEFKSSLLQNAISIIFNKAVSKMVESFESRAKELYS